MNWDSKDKIGSCSSRLCNGITFLTHLKCLAHRNALGLLDNQTTLSLSKGGAL